MNRILACKNENAAALPLIAPRNGFLLNKNSPRSLALHYDLEFSIAASWKSQANNKSTPHKGTLNNLDDKTCSLCEAPSPLLSKPSSEKSDEDLRNIQLMDKVIKWANGDQSLVDRARLQIKSASSRGSSGFYHKCPVQSCGAKFPSLELAELHILHTRGFHHNKYRAELGWRRPTMTGLGSGDTANRGKCQCCQRFCFFTQELADFHLKNAPDRKHSIYRKAHNMEQPWDREFSTW